MLVNSGNSSNEISLESVGQSHFIDLECVGLATIAFVERVRWGLTTPVELKAALLQLVSEKRSAAKEGPCGE